jgi:hypothetical protein
MPQASRLREYQGEACHARFLPVFALAGLRAARNSHAGNVPQGLRRRETRLSALEAREVVCAPTGRAGEV